MYPKSILRFAKTAVLFSLAAFLFYSSTADGSGLTDPPKENHYFHSIGENWVLNNGYYAKLYMTYDGYTLRSGQVLSGRGGFGGQTTDKRNQWGTISVTVKLYKSSGDVFVAEKSWSGSLDTSRKGFHWNYTPSGDSYWAIDCGFYFEKESSSGDGTIRVKVT